MSDTMLTIFAAAVYLLVMVCLLITGHHAIGLLMCVLLAIVIAICAFDQPKLP